MYGADCWESCRYLSAVYSCVASHPWGPIIISDPFSVNWGFHKHFFDIDLRIKLMDGFITERCHVLSSVLSPWQRHCWFTVESHFRPVFPDHRSYLTSQSHFLLGDASKSPGSCGWSGGGGGGPGWLSPNTEVEFSLLGWAGNVLVISDAWPGVRKRPLAGCTAGKRPLAPGCQQWSGERGACSMFTVWKLCISQYPDSKMSHSPQPLWYFIP